MMISYIIPRVHEEPLPASRRARLALLRRAKADGMTPLYWLWRKARAAIADRTSTDADTEFLFKVIDAIAEARGTSPFDSAVKLRVHIECQAIQHDTEDPEAYAAMLRLADEAIATSAPMAANDAPQVSDRLPAMVQGLDDLDLAIANTADPERRRILQHRRGSLAGEVKVTGAVSPDGISAKLRHFGAAVDAEDWDEAAIIAQVLRADIAIICG